MKIINVMKNKSKASMIEQILDFMNQIMIKTYC